MSRGGQGLRIKPIRFTSHANEKFLILARHGCHVERSQVLAILAQPDVVTQGHRGRRVAQGPLDQRHVLRVVFEEHENEFVVVTFFPARRDRYESQV